MSSTIVFYNSVGTDEEGVSILSNVDSKRIAYMNRIDLINGQAQSLNSNLNAIGGRIANVDSSLNGLPARILQLRNMNYRLMPSLEKDTSSLSEKWLASKPGVTELMNSYTPSLISEIRILTLELSQRRYDSSFEPMNLVSYESRVASLGSRISSLVGRVSSEIGDTESRMALINENVSVAENTINLTRSSSFAWKEGESPVISVRAKDLNKDVEGILSLTNLRFIYETEKDVVLKKTLFIATQKKKVRETAVDRPVGMVNEITKGRVGILAGQGLYITFKPESGLQEMKLDTKGNDTDLFIRFHNLISSGQADRELASLEPETKAEKNLPTVCPRCGAPYIGEIFRGQTSVQCRYCGTTIPISR